MKAGSFGIGSSFSLHPLKNLSVYGDGGIVTTNNDLLAENIKLLRNHGLVNRDESLIWGYNSRLDELQAAYGLLKLKYRAMDWKIYRNCSILFRKYYR